MRLNSHSSGKAETGSQACPTSKPGGRANEGSWRGTQVKSALYRAFVSDDGGRKAVNGVLAVRSQKGGPREHLASVTHSNIPVRTSEHPQYGCEIDRSECRCQPDERGRRRKPPRLGSTSPAWRQKPCLLVLLLSPKFLEQCQAESSRPSTSVC